MDASTPKGKLTAIRTIHFALMVGIALFVAVTCFIILKEEGRNGGDFGYLEYIPYVLVLIAYPVATFLFKSSISRIKKDSPLSTKMAQFNTAHIMQVAVLEAVALFSSVIAFVSQDIILYSVPIVVIILMLFLTPTSMKIQQLFELSREEAAELE